MFGKHLVKSFITQDYQEAVQKVLDDALSGKDTANFEFPLYSKNNKRIDILLNASSRFDGEGKVIGVVGVGQDITGRKMIEQERDEAAKERDRAAKDLERLIDSANAPIFGINVDGSVNEWNQQASKIMGYSKEEVLGKHLVKNYISPEFQVAVQKVLDDALRGEETANFEFPLFSKYGKRVEILLNASTRKDLSNNIVGVVGVGQDITGIKIAERDRQRVADDLARLIDRANAPIFGIAPDGTVNEWNQQA